MKRMIFSEKKSEQNTISFSDLKIISSEDVKPSVALCLVQVHCSCPRTDFVTITEKFMPGTSLMVQWFKTPHSQCRKPRFDRWPGI